MLTLTLSSPASQIKTRRLQEAKFTQDEVGKIMSQLINCLAFLQKFGIHHGDVRSQSVFVQKVLTKINVKLGDPTILNVTPSFVQCMTQGYRKGLYLSPKLFKSYIDRSWNSVHDKFKSDVFSLGNCTPKMPPPSTDAILMPVSTIWSHHFSHTLFIYFLFHIYMQAC